MNQCARSTRAQLSKSYIMPVPEDHSDRELRKSSAEIPRMDDQGLQAIAESIPGMVWVCTPDGRCRYVSQQWSEYTGSNLGQIGGRNFFSFFHPDDAARGQEAWKRAMDSSTLYDGDTRLRKFDGSFRWHRVYGAPQRSAGGMVTRWVILCVDIEALKEAQEKAAAMQAMLTQAKEELERKVEDRTRQLRETVEHLEAFAYTISHDMRTPLRAMHQYAETVTNDFGASVPAEAKVYLNKIMTAAEKLDSLIREVLVYTRVSQGKMTLRPVNLQDILSEVLVAHPQLNAPHVELNTRMPLHSVIGDETALIQALSNLLSNAVKFVPEGKMPIIRVWTEARGDKVRIFIHDNGIGIASADQKRIFEMFERLQPNSKYEGSGIGLTIVRRAVERMGGTMGVESAAGQGSTFWVELQKGETL
jgi:PAS domain S-box-containing protein